MKDWRPNLVLLLTCVLFIASCGADEAIDRSLTIGAPLFLTGNEYVRVAQEFQRGLELAVENADIPVNLLVEDTGLDMKKSVTVVRKFIDIDNVDALLLSYSDEVKAVGPIVETNKIPTVAYWESSPKIEGVGEYFFGIGLWQPYAGGLPAEFAWNELGARTAVVIYDQNEWAEAVARFFVKKFESLGGEVILQEVVLNETKDFRTPILRLINSDADVLFAPIGYHPVPFFRQLKEMDFKKPVLSSDGISSEIIEASSGAMNGVYFSNADDSMNPELEMLKKRYLEKFGEEASSIHQVALSHDALLLVVDAWKRSEGIGLCDAIYETENFKAALDSITINENRSFKREEVMFKIEDGMAKKIEF